MPGRGGREQARQAPVGVRSGDDVHLAGLQERLPEPFGHAAQHPDEHARARLAPHVELLEAAPDALLGVVAHGAGVHEDHVGLRRVVRAGVAFFAEDGEDDLRIRHVHLAAVCLYVYLSHKISQR